MGGSQHQQDEGRDPEGQRPGRKEVPKPDAALDPPRRLTPDGEIEVDAVTSFREVRSGLTVTAMRGVFLDVAERVIENSPTEALPSVAVIGAQAIPYLRGLIADPTDPVHLYSAALIVDGIEAALRDGAIRGYEGTSDPERVTSCVRVFATVVAVALSEDPVGNPRTEELLGDPGLYDACGLALAQGHAYVQYLLRSAHQGPSVEGGEK